MRKLPRLLAGTRGSVAVEFALFLPFFLILLFGIIEMGQAWYQKQMLVNATREGARMASLLNDDSNGTQMVTNQVNNFLNQSGYPGQVQVTVTGADGGVGAAVTVTATSNYTLPVLHNFVPSSLATVVLQATTVMRHE